MSDRPPPAPPPKDPPPPERSLADAIDEAVARDELAEIAARDPKQLAKELAEAGYDAARMKARIEAVRAEVYSAPVAVQPAVSSAPAAPAPPPAGKVVSLADARAKRMSPALITLIAAAAALVLFVGGGGMKWFGGDNRVGTGDPYADPSAARAHAAEQRDSALRACEKRDWRECERLLDDARSLDQEGEGLPAVKDARKRIDEAKRAMQRDP